MGYTYFLSKFFPEAVKKNEPQKQIITQTVEKNNQNIVKETTIEEKTQEENPKEEKTGVFETGKFNITYSLTGGYIKKIQIKQYQEYLSFSNFGRCDEDKNKEFVVVNNVNNKLEMREKNGDTTKEWVFDKYHVTFNIETSDPKTTTLFYNELSDKGLDQRYQEVFFSPTENLIERKPIKKVKDMLLKENLIIGARDRYYATVLLDSKYTVELAKNENKGVAFETNLLPGKAQFEYYIGPQIHKELRVYNLEKIINYGFWHPISILILKILAFLHGITNNWGLAIVLMSFAIYGLLFPFTRKSTQAMVKMQQIQPLMEELKEKYKDNPQKMNKEMIEIYKEHKVNPLGGCLPIFFQLPVFLALYSALLRLAVLKEASFLWINDLTLPDRAFKLGTSLPFFGEYINILPIIFVVLSFLQQKMSTASSANSQQQSTAMIFMVLIGAIFYHFPSCLVLYFLVQNLLTMVYQAKVRGLGIFQKA